MKLNKEEKRLIIAYVKYLNTIEELEVKDTRKITLYTLSFALIECNEKIGIIEPFIKEIIKKYNNLFIFYTYLRIIIKV